MNAMWICSQKLRLGTGLPCRRSGLADRVFDDIRMPEMDGLEPQERLTALALGFPMIVITGHADVPLAERAMKEGAVDFIEKPFASETILDSLRGIGFAERMRPGSGRSGRKAGAIVAARARGAGRSARRAAQQIDRL